MTSSATVRLLEAEPDLARFMTVGDAEALDGLAVPLVEVAPGAVDLVGLFAGRRAFAMMLLDGMFIRRIVVGQAGTIRLLGHGDVVSAPSGPASALIASGGWRAAARTRLAVLGRDLLVGVHRAPRMVAGLHLRGAEQADRVALQLAIGQLPRVEDRVLAMLWLLTESWGQVTAMGTALRLRLTHDTIGGLVGARRSTVTLAISELARRGSIARQDQGWLLLKPPPILAPLPPTEQDPVVLAALVGA